MNEKLLEGFPIKIPAWYMDIKYNPRIIPDGTLHNLLKTGANCQVFSYALLRLNGKNPPDLRSKELWEDTVHSEKTSQFEVLDILFFKKDQQPWGAHLGVYLGNNQVIHLSRKVGKPVVWDLDKFKTIPAYQVLIGAKRF